MPRAVTEQWDAGYPRVSTDIQVERDALQNQIQALEAHAAAHGLRLRLYPEAGLSAKDTDRPQLQELLADVRAGRVRSVVVTKLDRISRSLADLLDLMRLFEQHGVKFISLRDNIDTSGPVGRFMLHILGAIAELERAITAERVAEDMKLRARRGKWNGGLAPYGRRLVDGRLEIIAEEVAVLQRMRQLLHDKRSWRAVALALNREGKRTRGWAPVERDGRVVRKGKPPAEWAPETVKRVLLQPINVGTLVYNRRRPQGRTHVARPAEEHVVVEGFCAPIFTREEMDELLRIAAEIEGEPPARAGSTYLLSGLVYCQCGAKMYPVKNYVDTRQGRRPVVYYRCRRASHAGTCAMRQVPAAVLEPLVVRELRALGLDPERLQALAGAAEAQFAGAVQPLFARRAALAGELERLASRSEALIELAEDRLIGKPEFGARKARLDEERMATAEELATVERELRARAATAIDLAGALAGLERLSDIYDELEDVSERRRLLETCLHRLVVREDCVELHAPAYPTIVVRREDDADQADRAEPRAPAGGHRPPA
ncbi:MAG: serine recombinase [Dehalococcoidia bacterium]|nr:MAG: serine recombinase [Dehalococcoidia bacterium]